MFTGIVETTGKLFKITEGAIFVQTPWKAEDLHIGQSVAIDGCCLTIVEIEESTLKFEVSPETIQRTTLEYRQEGDSVDLERGVRIGERLDGHLVTGHVDTRGKLEKIETLDRGHRNYIFSVPEKSQKWLIEKGSIAVDGVSLTVNEISNQGFSVVLIPHTLEITALGERKLGDHVNLEFDLMAKYLHRWTMEERSPQGGQDALR